MASKKKQKPVDADTAPGSSKLKTIGTAVAFVAVGAVVGPQLLGTGAAAETGAAPTTTTVAPGPVVVLEKVTLNLADGHLLQAGLALELSAEHAADAGHGGEAAEDDPTKGYAKAIDAAIGILGEQTMASLSEPGGRDRAKHELEEALLELYHGEVVGVFFHQFVMQ